MSRRRTMEYSQELMKMPSGTLPDYGAIFMSNRSTKEECLKTKLFGLPLSFASFVEKIKVGMVLFLFEHGQRELYGVFEAISDGTLNIVPRAYRSSGMKFPAQVLVKQIWSCHPLSEHLFHGAIKDNYYEPHKFHFGLSKDQVNKLLWLFDSKKIRIKKSINLFSKTEVAKSHHRTSSTGKPVEKGRLITAEISGEISVMDVSESVNVTKYPKLSDTTSSYDIGAQSTTNSVSEKNVDMSSSNLTTELCDYIPLDSPGHYDPTETTYPLVDNAPGPIFPIISEDSPFHQTDDLSVFARLKSVIIRTPDYEESDDKDANHSLKGLDSDTLEERDTKTDDFSFFATLLKSEIVQSPECEVLDDKDVNPSIKGLYSDTLEERDTVFSRLNLASKLIAQEEKEKLKERNTVFARLNLASKHIVGEKKKESNIIENSVEEIMDKLQRRHERSRKKAREAIFNENEAEDNLKKKKKRASVFSRLNLPPKDMSSEECSASKESTRSCVPSVDDKMHLVYQHEFEKVLMNNDLSVTEVVSIVNCYCYVDVQAKPVITNKRILLEYGDISTDTEGLGRPYGVVGSERLTTSDEEIVLEKEK